MASPAHVSPSSRRADDDPEDASSIISTTTIREKTNLVIMAIYELCAPAASSDSLMIGEWRGKICTTALKLSIGLSLAIYRSTGFLLDICDEV